MYACEVLAISGECPAYANQGGFDDDDVFLLYLFSDIGFVEEIFTAYDFR